MEKLLIMLFKGIVFGSMLTFIFFCSVTISQLIIQEIIFTRFGKIYELFIYFGAGVFSWQLAYTLRDKFEK